MHTKKFEFKSFDFFWMEMWKQASVQKRLASWADTGDSGLKEDNRICRHDKT